MPAYQWTKSAEDPNCCTTKDVSEGFSAERFYVPFLVHHSLTTICEGSKRI